MSLNEKERVELYFLMPPVDLSGKKISVIIYDINEKSWSSEIEGKNIEAGMTYGWDIVPATTEPSYTDLVNIIETKHDGFKVHINVPDETIARGNRIRYGGTCIPWYNVISKSYEQLGSNYIDAMWISMNGDPYGKYNKLIENDTTFFWDSSNCVALNEYGEPITDEFGEYITLHDPIVPGEPYIMMAGEVTYGSREDYENIMQFTPAIQGNAWIVPLYDFNTGSWTGAFEKKEFIVSPTSPCEATVSIEIPEDEITCIDARILFTPNGNVFRYFYMIVDDPTYNVLLEEYLGGNEDWFQWFLTSYLAAIELGIRDNTGYLNVNAAQSFPDGTLIAGNRYHVLCTVHGDEKGLTSGFIHKTFTAKEKTKAAPVIEIRAVEGNDPYTARFNVKAPSKDIVGAYFATNYAREFEQAFDEGHSYESIVKGNNHFDNGFIEMINSDEGLTLDFPSLDGETIRLAVYGCNDEYTFNYIDSSIEGRGWADCKVPMAEKDSKIDSPLYDVLTGDWTATATLSFNEDIGEAVVARQIEHKSKITISNEIIMPEKLSDADYSLYENAGISRDETDLMYSELKTQTDRFGEYRLEGKNRMLCSGFLDFDYYSNGRMTYRSPYDLFTSTDYTSIDVPQLVYDFGPKWYLELQQDGSVIVPFDSQKLPPMHAWAGYPFYLGGFGNGMGFYNPSDRYHGFPVEISDDYNTITIKPIVIDNENYYMNALGIPSDYQLEVIATVVSDIVLTRGWTETRASDKVMTKAKATSVRSSDALPQKRIVKSMTDFSDIKAAPQYKVDETPNVVTMEMVNATTEKILKKYR